MLCTYPTALNLWHIQYIYHSSVALKQTEQYALINTVHNFSFIYTSNSIYKVQDGQRHTAYQITGSDVHPLRESKYPIRRGFGQWSTPETDESQHRQFPLPSQFTSSHRRKQHLTMISIKPQLACLMDLASCAPRLRVYAR